MASRAAFMKAFPFATSTDGTVPGPRILMTHCPRTEGAFQIVGIVKRPAEALPSGPILATMRGILPLPPGGQLRIGRQKLVILYWAGGASLYRE
jgi:hypothetical protein